VSQPRVYPHIAAIIGALEDAGLRVGDHRAPKSADDRIAAPCNVLYMAPSAEPFGSLGRPGTDVLMRFRVTSVDITPEGAANQADLVFDALEGTELIVEDRAIFRVRRSALAGVVRDDDVKPPCFYAATPYQMLSMSASPAS
jgi:hypothetical protein